MIVSKQLWAEQELHHGCTNADVRCNHIQVEVSPERGSGEPADRRAGAESCRRRETGLTGDLSAKTPSD